MNTKKNMWLGIAFVWLGVVAAPLVYAADTIIGFEEEEGYTIGEKPLDPWLCRAANNTTSETVRVSSTQVHSGSQSLSITPDSYDYAVYPVEVQTNQTAAFTVWIRPSSHLNNEAMGAVSVVELDNASDYWYANCGAGFSYNIFAEPEDGSTSYNLTFDDGYTSRVVGDFTPETWYPVECRITPSEIIYIVTVNTGTYTNAFPRSEGYKVTEIRLHGRQFMVDPEYLSQDQQIVYFDDFTYTPPETVPLMLLEDFERYGNGGYLTPPWTATPGSLGLGIRTAFDENSNTYAKGDWEVFGDSAQRPMPFSFNTTQDDVYFQFTGRINVPLPDWYGYGDSLLCFYDESATNTFFVFGMFQNNWNSSTVPQCALSVGTNTIVGDSLLVNQPYEFRGQIDWTYQNEQGKYGLFTLLRRPKGGIQWTTDSVLNQIELNVADPTEITRLGMRVDFFGSYVGGEMDDIYYYAPEPPTPVTLSVASPMGSPSPAAGLYTNSYNTVVTCSVQPVTEGLTQYSCIGWIGTGSVPSSGTSNAVEITMTEDSSITWLWQTNYWLEAVTSGQGQVDGGNVWAAKNSQIGLTAVPETGWLFMGWSGDAAGTNIVTLLMDEPKSVTAVFSDDADGDGLTNTEEETVGSNPWSTDTDRDGFNDKLEVDNGGSPTVSDAWRVEYIRDNAADFKMSTSNSVIDIAVGQMLLETVDGMATMYLQLEQSDDLSTWTNAGEAVIWEIPNDSPTQFFRVRSEK